MKQLVKEPTRKQYLLDLVLSNIPELVKVTVLPEISDHRVVNIEVNAVVSISPAIERTVWMFTKADWDGLKADSHLLIGNFFSRTSTLRAQYTISATTLKLAASAVSRDELFPRESAATLGWTPNASPQCKPSVLPLGQMNFERKNWNVSVF